MNISLKLLFPNDELTRHMGANPQTTFRRLNSSFSILGTALKKPRYFTNNLWGSLQKIDWENRESAGILYTENF